MKDLKTTLCALSLLAGSLLAWSTPQVPQRPRIISHRGFWKAAGAQNAISGLVKADSIGAWGAELDVWITPDDVVVLNHNATIGGHVVAETPYHGVLDTIRLKNGELMPTFAQYLEAARPLDINLVVEIKPHKDAEREAACVDSVIALVDRSGIRDRVIYISFSRPACERLVKQSDRPVQYLTTSSPEVVAEMGVDGIDFNLGLMRKHPDWYATYRRQGTPINLWTVNRDDDLRWCIAEAVDYITTDNPDVALAMTDVPMTAVEWTADGNEQGDGSHPYYVERFTVASDRPLSRLCFNQFARKFTPVNPLDTIIELVPGYYAIASPRLERLAPGDTLEIAFKVNGTLRHRSFGPDGLHGVTLDGKAYPVYATYNALIDAPQRYTLPGSDLNPSALQIFEENERLLGGWSGTFSTIPSYNDVKITGKTPHEIVEIVKEEVPALSGVTITIKDGKVTLAGDDMRNVEAAYRKFVEQVAVPADNKLPDAVIRESADMDHRGVMIDIVRNFIGPEALKKIVGELALYGINRLHLHLTDDEGWRLEIPGLPELTEYGGRRGYTTDESEYPVQLYAGDGNPANRNLTSNGYLTRAQYIDLIQYCDSLGVTVIPEIESPGHARAAVKSMEYRHRTTGDDTYLLREADDTSTYTSAQAYHDNVMNPALEGTYRFMDKVIAEVADMHREAGVALPAIHIGGDEVAKGAWNGSKAAQAYMKEHGITDQHHFHGEFVRRLADSFRSRGIAMMGWQEIGVGQTPEYTEEIRPLIYGLNAWRGPVAGKGTDPMTREALAAEYPVILSNATYYYIDMAYNHHPDEPGMTWANPVDELRALHGYPSAIVGSDLRGVKGVQAQLFAETLRSPSMYEYYIFPKVLGVAERAWHAEPTYTDEDFEAVIAAKLMPRWEKAGINYHVRQPGMRAAGGMVEMNAPYAGAVIEYSTDGGESWHVYEGPIEQPAGELRAVTVMGSHRSLPTVLR